MACSIAGLIALGFAVPLLGQQPVSQYVPQNPVFRSADSVSPGQVEFQRSGTTSKQAVVQSQGVQPKKKSADLEGPGEAIPRTQADDLLEYQIRLDPPSIDVVTGMGSEKSLEERMRQESIQRGGQEIRFPAKAPVSTKAYVPRVFASAKICAENRYVSYNPLYFEDLNAERYGWDLGFVQPFVSAAYFYKDFLFLPYHMASYPNRKFETSAGKCLPGDPVPYILYPPQLTLSGTAAEAGVAVGLVPIFP